MCGILAILAAREQQQHLLRQRALQLARLLRHRGPDWSGIHVSDSLKSALVHERLSIVDVDGGAQPLFNEDNSIVLTVNGEIYNHQSIRDELCKEHKFKTASDCEVILHLYEQFGPLETCKRLSGDFAFVLLDEAKGTVFAARDPIGVVPLYMGKGHDGSSLWLASEMKALKEDCSEFEVFPPGTMLTASLTRDDNGGLVSIQNMQMVRYYDPSWFSDLPEPESDLDKLRCRFEDAVVKRMMCDVPYGVLLSGGLDSSLVSSIVVRHSERRIEDHEQSKAWWPRVHSFSIGLAGAPDLIAARVVAKFLDTVHHEFHFTVQEGLDALRDVIWHIETYDVTTIRASTPMYLLSRRIKAMGIKMILSGEGSDEVFGGYLYFHNAPSAEEFHRETVCRIKNLHKFDCLRANKSTTAWGLEVRVPFLDKDFLDVAMGINPREKQCSKGKIEKFLLRKAFDTKDRPYLPDSVLWRQKEQFSDGVGYGWIDSLKAHAESQISDEEFARCADVFADDTPTTKEGLLYRKLFVSMFPGPCCRETVSHWVPTWGASADPSGRAQQIHMAPLEEGSE